MQWVEPELFLVHKGVGVWRTYKGGSVTQYHFTVVCENDDVENCDSETGGQFDVRDLSCELREAPIRLPGETEEQHHRAVIIRAINEGYFDSWERSPVDEASASSWELRCDRATNSLRVARGVQEVLVNSSIPEEIRLPLAAEIKRLMENPEELKSGRRVAVYVSGGCVDNVMASFPGAKVILVDYDTGRDDKTVAALQWAEAEAARVCKHPTEEA
jgi:hypothetical protein